MPSSDGGRPIKLRIGHDELLIRRRYEAVSIGNDMLIAGWFILGSILFFSPQYTEVGTWCFLLGSVELLIRPLIRLTRLVHLRRIHAAFGGPESGQDY